VLFEHLETLLLGLYFHDNYYISNVYLQVSSAVKLLVWRRPSTFRIGMATAIPAR